jgi:hypothetical protein
MSPGGNFIGYIAEAWDTFIFKDRNSDYCRPGHVCGNLVVGYYLGSALFRLVVLGRDLGGTPLGSALGSDKGLKVDGAALFYVTGAILLLVEVVPGITTYTRVPGVCSQQGRADRPGLCSLRDTSSRPPGSYCERDLGPRT